MLHVSLHFVMSVWFLMRSIPKEKAKKAVVSGRNYNVVNHPFVHVAANVFLRPYNDFHNMSGLLRAKFIVTLQEWRSYMVSNGSSYSNVLKQCDTP